MLAQSLQQNFVENEEILKQQQDFIEEQVEQFLQELPNESEDLIEKEKLFEKLNQYDLKFHQKYKTLQIDEQTQAFYDENKLQKLPEKEETSQFFMKKTFVADSGYLHKYEQMNRLYDEKNPQIKDQQDFYNQQDQNIQWQQEIPVKEFLNQQFTNIKHNFQDVNANSRLANQRKPPRPGQESKKNKQDECECNENKFCQYHERQIFYQNDNSLTKEQQQRIYQQKQFEQNSQFMTQSQKNLAQQQALIMQKDEDYKKKIYMQENLKNNIEKLGGIDDNINVLFKSLRENEARNNNFDYQDLENQKTGKKFSNSQNISFHQFKQRRQSIEKSLK